MGVFNVSLRPLTEMIPLSSFPGTVSTLTSVIRAYTSGKVSRPTKVGSPGSLIIGSLDVRGYEIYSAFPLTAYRTGGLGEILVASLGLLEKMTGCAAIVSNESKQLENGRILIDTRVKALGVLGKQARS